MIAPVVVCRESELSEAGAFYTMDVGSVAILVVRDTKGTIRAFVNLCRHRGVRLVHERTGVTRTFTCLLHGWSYDAEGQMGGAVVARLARDNPMMAALRTQNALVPLPTELRHGFVWVAPSPRAAIDVAAFLGALDAELAARDLASYVVHARTESAMPDDARALSKDLAFVTARDSLSIFTRHERRTENDFGEEPDEEVAPVRTIERLDLVAPR